MGRRLANEIIHYLNFRFYQENGDRLYFNNVDYYRDLIKRKKYPYGLRWSKESFVRPQIGRGIIRDFEQPRIFELWANTYSRRCEDCDFRMLDTLTSCKTCKSGLCSFCTAETNPCQICKQWECIECENGNTVGWTKCQIQQCNTLVCDSCRHDHHRLHLRRVITFAVLGLGLTELPILRAIDLSFEWREFY